jgi:hypothetical protein
MTLLRAYFDESGTHAGSPVVFIAGLMGSLEKWDETCLQWQEAMKGEIFHYTAFYTETELLNNLAEIISSSGLQFIGAGFSGNWEKAISTEADWVKRFPSAYNFAFEMCIEQITRAWPDSQIELIFSEQNQYEKRAEEVWRTFRGNGYWKNFIDFSYETPKRLSELQIADMVVHETFQCMKAGTLEAWNKWPLMKRLVKSDNTYSGGYQTEKSFIEMMRRADKDGRQYLKTIPK